MNLAFPLLICAALGTLALGYRAFTLTCSKGVRLLTCLGAIGLTFAAFSMHKPGGAQSAANIAFVVAMLFAGRAVGIWWQSRRNAELREPSQMLFAAAGITMVAAATAFLS